MNEQEYIDWVLKKMDVESLEKLETLVQLGKECQSLDTYRTALSLWAEYHKQSGRRVICTIDGRDTAGKGNNILEITHFLSAIEIMKAIIRSNPKICSRVEEELDIDLSPDIEIVRTADQELKRMQDSGSMDTAVKDFPFLEK